ncbi:MAG: hypothetical protein WDZ50_08050 [Woeseia sp.]
MSEPNSITNRLIALSEDLADDLSVETVVLSDSGVMDTDELKQLLEADSGTDSSDLKSPDESV